MTTKKPAAFLAFAGACALALTGPAAFAAPPTPADTRPDAGATASSLANPLVDPRFSYVSKGSAPYVEYLGVQENPNGTGWATARNSGYDIIAMMKSYFG